eukprot:jgi/Astpho2/7643/Aster-x0328
MNVRSRSLADHPEASLVDKIKADVPGVRFVDLDTRPQPEHHKQVLIGGFAIKVYAIYSSAFQEVVFLDADCMPLRDPEILFDTHEYRQGCCGLEPVAAGASAVMPRLQGRMRNASKADAMQCRHHGTTFFPDFQHQQHASDFMYSTFSLPHPNHDPAFHEAESGQLVIDRRRHWESLEYIWMLATHSDIMFQHGAHGDKDQFRLAFALSGNPDSYYQCKL